MASKLHCRNYLPKQIPIFLQTHFHPLYSDIPKNSVPAPFRMTVVKLSVFCCSPFPTGTAFASDVSEPPHEDLLCPLPQAVQYRNGTRQEGLQTSNPHGTRSWSFSLIPQSNTSKTTASSLVSSKSNSASLIQADFTSEIKCSLWEHSVD